MGDGKEYLRAAILCHRQRAELLCHGRRFRQANQDLAVGFGRSPTRTSLPRVIEVFHFKIAQRTCFEGMPAGNEGAIWQETLYVARQVVPVTHFALPFSDALFDVHITTFPDSIGVVELPEGDDGRFLQ